MTISGTQHAADHTIRATVRALRSARQIDAADLACKIGISRQALYNRLNGHAPWLAREVADLAAYFSCSVQDLYDGVVRVAPAGSRPPGSGRVSKHYSPARALASVTALTAVARRGRITRQSTPVWVGHAA